MTSNRLIRDADRAAGILSILGNGKRFRIMCHLMDGELSVGVIAEKVELSQSALSQHLAKLRALDIVETRRDRQTIYYSCKSKEVRDLISCVEHIFAPAFVETGNVKSFRARH